jgi:hypothetical protein
VGDQGGEEPVDPDRVGEPLAVGDREGLVAPPVELLAVDAAFGGEDECAERAEHVVEGRGAGRPPRAEAIENFQLGERAEAVFGAVEGVERDRGKLSGGEDLMLVDQSREVAVAVGEVGGEPGELGGGGARPAARR